VDHFEIVLAALIVAVAGLNVLAGRLGIPYPIPLVLGGLVIGLIPPLPDISLNPDLVLLVFLPPLLYAAAFFSDQHALRKDLRAVSTMAIGLVLVTTGVVGVIAHEVLHFNWAISFALGAIVSPTDPVAATAIMRRVGAPRRIVNLVEGESLINDAGALVAYRFAVAAAVGGSFSALDAGLEFVGVTAGGVAVGLGMGWAVAEIRRRLDDPLTEITISLLTAYAAFIPAEELGLSGVLASVSAGVYLGWRAPELIGPQTRIRAYSTWEVLVFLLNATLFMLIGLQLPTIVDGIEGLAASEVIGYSALICATVIAVRFAWLFSMPYVLRLLDRRDSQRERRVPAAERVVVAWAGMRGAVSLAAALALPLETDAGAPLPDRDLVLFIAFVLILVTVVGQGLTLPGLIRRLGVREDAAEEEAEELKARLAIARVALERLDELESEKWTLEESLERARRLYGFRHRRFKTQAGKLEDDGIEDRSLSYQRMMHEVFGAQRHALVGLRNEGEISSEVMRRIERELDLEESRLEV
jgi:CPA1 family monovalent cation:H+ antiporter